MNIVRFGETTHGHPLDGLRCTVIGAGPAGLVFARAAATLGADVTVLEQAGDPRGKDPGYTNRSFNITLDNVGRQVLGDARGWKGGTWLMGRAVHNVQDSSDVVYTRYGALSDEEFVSIPRPVLRQNLAHLAEEAGAKLTFNTRVVDANTETGEVSFISHDTKSGSLSADLIIMSDGLHSLANELCGKDSIAWKPEPKSYVTALLRPEDRHNLSLRHIHFWHETSGAYTVGIPNVDGSVGLLLVSCFDDDKSKHPFQTPALAAARLQAEFPRLFHNAPNLPSQLPAMQYGHFCYKAMKQYRIGKKGVIVGDSGCTVPPWAGYGANTAMYAASSLVHILATESQGTESALERYDLQSRALAQLLMQFVQDQGEFLSGEVASNPAGRSEAALADIVRQAQAPTPSDQPEMLLRDLLA